MLRQSQLDHSKRVEALITESGLKRALFGAGCFWSVEQKFSLLEGVVQTAVGYAGGTVEYPDYRSVCSGTTGHAEVVEVLFDPEAITFSRLVTEFFKMHDPTTLNRQGYDIGSQYRSVIFYTDEEQKKAAETIITELENSRVFRSLIVTEISPAATFFRAEEYHQKYNQKNGYSCS